MWRPILAKIVTLQELDTHWTMCDLADANEALDVQSEVDKFMADKQGESQ